MKLNKNTKYFPPNCLLHWKTRTGKLHLLKSFLTFPRYFKNKFLENSPRRLPRGYEIAMIGTWLAIQLCKHLFSSPLVPCFLAVQYMYIYICKNFLFLTEEIAWFMISVFSLQSQNQNPAVITDLLSAVTDIFISSIHSQWINLSPCYLLSFSLSLFSLPSILSFFLSFLFLYFLSLCSPIYIYQI